MAKIKLYLKNGSVLEFKSLNQSEVKEIKEFGRVEIGFTKFGINSWSLKTKRITNIYPTHLEIITEKECPNCIDHLGRELPITRPEYSDVKSLNQPCPSCDSGKIESVTFLGIFNKSKEEYDEALLYKDYKGLIHASICKCKFCKMKVKRTIRSTQGGLIDG